MKYTLNDIFKEQSGFALLTTILSTVLMLILGFTIIWVTTSNFKMAKVDSLSQSAYYIAEAGINYMIDKINTEVKNSCENFDLNEDFFEYIENMFMGEKTLGDFEKNNGIEPGATVIVNLHENIDENTREYEIRSVGEIGSSKRAVNSIIRLERKSGKGTINIEDIDGLFIYGSSISFLGKWINGEGGTIILGGLKTDDLNQGAKLNVTNIYFNGPVIMDGGSASFGNENEPGLIYVNGDLDLWDGSRNVYGDIIVKGNFRLKDAKIHGDVYVEGDLELGNTPEIDKKIYYTGEIEYPLYGFPEALLNKCEKVDSMSPFTIPSFPSFDIKLKEDLWYEQNGYDVLGEITNGTVPDYAKIFAEDYTGLAPQNIKGNIIIISKGNINITAPWGGTGITGALIAPNGSIKIEQQYFTGVIISKDGFTSNANQGATVDMLEISDFFTEDILPIIVYEKNGSDNGNGGTGDNGSGDEGSQKGKLEIIEPIREI